MARAMSMTSSGIPDSMNALAMIHRDQPSRAAPEPRPPHPAAGARRRRCPARSISLILLWTGDYTPKVQWTLTVLIVGVLARLRVRAPRARRPAAADALEPARRAARGRLLDPRARRARRRSARRGDDRGQRARRDAARQRLGALEATALLRTVMAEIDVAVFTFDEEHELRLVNRAGERLLAQPAERLLGRDADELGLRRLPRPATRRASSTRRFPGGVGRWEVRRSHVPAGRPAARAARARRPQPAAARRGAAGVAAADSRHRPRDQQLARADQVDRRQPRDDRRARAAAGGLARRHAARPRA